MTDSLPKPISIAGKLGQVQALWTPHRIAQFDGHQLVLARVQGDFVWHDHKDHDEVFLPIHGTLWMDLKNPDGGEVKEVRVDPGELFVVPAGMSHRPRTQNDEEVTLLVIDPLNVRHTGDTQSDRTVAEYPVI